jgi:long-subunit acyl-CoA synthetase (AMP-forming)
MKMNRIYEKTSIKIEKKARKNSHRKKSVFDIANQISSAFEVQENSDKRLKELLTSPKK